MPICLILQPARFLRCWAALGLLAGAYTAATTWWVCLTGPGYALLVVLVSAYAALFFVIPAACCRAAGASSNPAAPLLVLPAAWALAEVLARRVALGISWAIVGLPLADWPVLAQGASLVGPEALSFLVVASGVSIALPLRRCPAWAILLGIAQGPGLLVVALLWGGSHLNVPRPAAPSLKAAAIQPNIPQDRKWDPAGRKAMLADFDRLVDRALVGDPDILVLPETAVPGFVRYEDDLSAWVKSTVERTKRPLLFGSLDRNADASEFSNVAIMITPYNTVTTYRKIRLVPVTERIPAIAPLRRLFIALRGGPEEFTPGAEYTLFELKGGITFATMICFEDIFPDIARGFALDGAQALIALVNTERFKDSSQGWAHLRRARLTAVSVGLPLLRCTNSGISCLIDADGRILSRLEGDRGEIQMVAGTRLFELPLSGHATPYRRRGDTIPLACYGGLIVLVAGIVLCRRGLAALRRRDAPPPAEPGSQ